MKKQIAALLIAATLVGCNQHQKSRIEEEFEKYLSATFVVCPEVDKMISINKTDSMDIVGFAQNSILLLDSINREYLLSTNAFVAADKKLPQSKLGKYRDKVLPIINYGIYEHKNKAIEMIDVKDYLQSILNHADTTRKQNIHYEISVKIKDVSEPVTYYALDCALVDTVIFSQAPISIDELPVVLKAATLNMSKITSYNSHLSNVILQQRTIAKQMEDE